MNSLYTPVSQDVNTEEKCCSGLILAGKELLDRNTRREGPLSLEPVMTVHVSHRPPGLGSQTSKGDYN